MALYGFGSVSNGVKNRSFSAFLLLFYNQVLGVPAAWVGAAMMIALIIDGFIDPIIGQFSDNLRTPWGRRHPLMYIAAPPYAVAFVMLWHPPTGWSNEALLAYMVACVVSIRLFDTFFEVPAAAMAPELTDDYDQRTSLVSFRYFFTVVGGLALSLVAYRVFLAETPANPEGMFSREAYGSYAFVAAAVIAASILISTVGTHSRIPWLRKPPARKMTIKGSVREIIETLSNGSLWVSTAAGMFAAIANGVIGGLSTYFHVYFWELSPHELVYVVGAGFAASLLGIVLVPRIAARLGKREGAILMFGAAIVVAGTLPAMRLLGLLPENGHPAILPLVMAETLLAGALNLMTTISITSMILDIAEDSELKTGRRSEALLVSADNLLKKSVAGAGVFTSGLILTIVEFPQKARPGGVPAESLREMAMIFIPTVVVLYVGAIVSLWFYRLDRAGHEQNLRTLRERQETRTPVASGDRS
jgi:GPH family glycoside/pentoside/hexuronide:cation symporter